MRIDIHTHVFPKELAPRAIPKLEEAARMRARLDGTPDGLLASMAAAGIDVSVTLPVATNPRQPRKLNELAARDAERFGGRGLLPFGAAHPDDPNWKEELDFLAAHGVKGIKLHPMYQETDLDDPRSLRIIGRAAELGLIVLVHAGEDIGIPGPSRCSPRHVLRVLRETGIDRLVLAHMGGWGIWDEVKQELAGAPVYFDTSFSFGSAAFHPAWPRSPEELRLGDPVLLGELVRIHGIDRVLFGSDSPWGDQRESMDELGRLGLSDAELEAVLGGNAARLLGL